MTCGYTINMKIAISLPDELFGLADEFARTLDISRSELYAAAIQEYMTNHAKVDLVECIDAACAQVDTNLADDVAAVTHKMLLESEW